MRTLLSNYRHIDCASSTNAVSATERFHWKYEIDLGNDDYGPYNLLQAALCDADHIFRGVISYDLNCSLWPADWTQDDIDNEQEMWACSSMT
jgi:hypothetical protein